MDRGRFRLLLALSLGCLALLLPGVPAAQTEEAAPSPFPRPAPLEPNVRFWKQVYVEYGVEEFVLHDRQRLDLVYEVVRVPGTASQPRAAELAQPEIRRARARAEGILQALAQGVSPEAFGPPAQAILDRLGCPCPPEVLERAAGGVRAQQGLRQRVEEGLARSRTLLPRIVSILRRHEVPVELAALPLVESAFDPTARSKAGAVGLWQFIHSTGRQYLTISRRRDDRRDPIRSTEAAARLLRHNYQALGSWPLAVMAYNHGQHGILTAKGTVGSSAVEEIVARYAGPRFGFASRNFYAQFLAAVEILGPTIAQHDQATSPSRRPTRVARAG